MNAACYINVLDSHLLVFMNIHGCMIFQQDSAPCNKVKAVTKWFQDKNVNKLQWPENSLDLNPIKNLWIENPLIKKKSLNLIQEAWKN